MDRIHRSSPADCSCSGRAEIKICKLGRNFWGLQRRRTECTATSPHIATLPCYGGRCRAHVCVRSQSPRQQGGGAPGSGGEEDTVQPAEGRIISSLVTSGLSGTVAVIGAAIARIDLFGQFHWLSTDDLLLGLTSASGVLVLEAALLAPPYTRLLGGAGRPGAKAGAVGLRLRTEELGRLTSGDSLAATLVLQQACLVAEQAVRRRGLARVSPLLEGSLVALREAAKELLQRGLLLTLLAGWLADRAFEAGAEDTLSLSLNLHLLPHPVVDSVTQMGMNGGGGGAAAWANEVYLTDAARYVAAALVTASVMPAVVNEAEALRLGVASNLALVMVEQRAEAEAEEQRRARAIRGRQMQGQATGQLMLGEGEGERGNSGGCEGVVEAGAEVYDEDLDGSETEAMLREYRLVEALGRSTSTGPPRLTYGLTLLRGLLRFAAPNLTFALTGNLAASMVASLVPQLMLLTYVLRGPMVLLERGPTPPFRRPESDTRDDS